MLGSDYPLYKLLLIPVFSGLIGYVTNVAAVKMMFYPIKFVGIRPFLGWQGIIPASAVDLIRNTHRLVLERLVSVKDLFATQSPDQFIDPARERIEALTRATVEEEAATHLGPMWNSLAPEIQEQVVQMANTEVLGATKAIVQRVMDDVEELIDIEGLAISAAEEDRTLMNRMFLDVGKEEFIFIERSGAYFGFLFGLGQMVAWALFPKWWILPFFGLLVGWVTNSVAIKLIFEPREPKRIAGLKVQGLFHQRQTEVAHEFGKLVASEVFSDKRLFAQIDDPHARKTVMNWVEAEVDVILEKYKNHPMAAMAPPELIQNAREKVIQEVESELFREDGLLASVSAQSALLRKEIQTRMAALDPLSFENVLRPAFQQEEWKLVLAGAVLGLGAGFLQLFYLFGEAWAASNF